MHRLAQLEVDWHVLLVGRKRFRTSLALNTGQTLASHFRSLLGSQDRQSLRFAVYRGALEALLGFQQP